jgi:3-methyladenine DNA glycosylase/8-oxoguanine DNA glycosylase
MNTPTSGPTPPRPQPPPPGAPPPPGTEPPSRELVAPERYELAGSLFPLSVGRDPCVRLTAGELWWACRTPAGPGTLHLARRGGTLDATGYGPGARWLLDRADAVAGLRDDVSGFLAMARSHPVLAAAWHHRSGLRLPATGRIFQHLVPTILAQKVSGKEAAHAYARLARHFGEQAPGPVDGLLLPADPAVLAGTPYWVLHPFGVERKRADTLRRAAAEATRLDALATRLLPPAPAGDPDAPLAGYLDAPPAGDPDVPPAGGAAVGGESDRARLLAELTARLTAIPGIGAWTAAEVVRLATGDPDVVSVGDWNIPHHVVFALTGAVRAGARDSTPGRLSAADQRMLAELEPFRGQRGRVCELLVRATPGPPRFGPRLELRSFARF